MARRPPAIGILGGTFAPIHLGHLRIAIEACEQLRLDEVRLIPAAAPPLRATPPVSARRRLRWVRLAIAQEPRLAADDRELRRGGASFTVDSLAELRREHPRSPLCLLLGQDAARQLPRWHRWRELLDFAHLVFFHRPGVPAALPAAVQRQLRGRAARSPRALLATPRGRWLRCPAPGLDVSATDVRRRLRAGLSVRGLVPDAVLRDWRRADVAALADA